MVKFMRAEDGSMFNVEQIAAVGLANTIRRSKGFGPYLMVELSSGRTVVPVRPDTGAAWPVAALDEFLDRVSGPQVGAPG